MALPFKNPEGKRLGMRVRRVVRGDHPARVAKGALRGGRAAVDASSMPVEDAPCTSPADQPKKRLTIPSAATRAVGPNGHTPCCRTLACHKCPSRCSLTACPVRGRLPDHRGVLSVGWRLHYGNKVLAQNMMCATTSKAARAQPSASWRRRPLSAPDPVRPPQTPACLGPPAAWAALALTHRPDFSTQARPGGGSVHHHCSHGRGDKILARQLRRRHCYSRSHKTGAGGTRPSGCK